MNIVCLQLKITSCRVQLPELSKISFSLRLGSILSPPSSPVDLNNQGYSLQQINLSISCDENTLMMNPRACLIVSSAEQKDKKIIGMSFVFLDKIDKPSGREFKIQQCADRNAFLIVIPSIFGLEVNHRHENESITSKSSLNQIKELHIELSKGHRKKKSDINQSKRIPIEIQRFPTEERDSDDDKNQNSFIVKNFSRENDIIDELEQKLNEAYEKNSILKHLLTIQERKFKVAQKFIQNQAGRPIQEPLINGNNQEFRQLQTIEAEEKMQNLTDFHKVAKERDELYHVCEELYKKTKSLRVQSQELIETVKEKQNEIYYLQEEIEDLKKQNIELKTKMFEFCDKDDLMLKNTSLMQENQKLKVENKELERKFKESFKAIESFKNDALQAREQIINKDEEIQRLSKQIQEKKERDFNSSMLENEFREMLSILHEIEINKETNLSMLLLKREKFELEVEEWQMKKGIQERLRKRANQIYSEYYRKRTKSIDVIELRKHLMSLVNQI